MRVDFRFEMMVAIQSSRLIHPRLRPFVLRAGGLNVSHRISVFPGVYFGSRRITVEDDCFISMGCFLDGSDSIFIGRHTHLGPLVRILTSTHDIGPHEGRAGPLRRAPVHIGAGCWLGAGATILPGVSIGDGCVIGAGSLVTRSTEPDGLYLGDPARRLRDLPT